MTQSSVVLLLVMGVSSLGVTASPADNRSTEINESSNTQDPWTGSTTEESQKEISNTQDPWTAPTIDDSQKDSAYTQDSWTALTTEDSQNKSAYTQDSWAALTTEDSHNDIAYTQDSWTASTTEGQSDVSFLAVRDDSVQMYNTSSLSVSDTLVTTTYMAHAVDYHYAKNLLFVSTQDKIYKKNLTTKNPSLTLVGDTIRTMNPSCRHAMVVDWMRDKILWVECDLDTTINIMDLDGENMSVLMTRPGNKNKIFMMLVDPFAEMIFWTAGGVIESCELSGGNFKTNLRSNAVDDLSLALNLGERRIYYVGMIDYDLSWRLFSMNYEGGSHRKHFSSEHLSNVFGLGVHMGYVYWDNYENGKDILYKASLDLASTDSVHAVKDMGRFVNYLRVLHEDLQPTRDPCVSEACERTNQTLAPCPEGYQLSSNEVKCTSQSDVSFLIGLDFFVRLYNMSSLPEYDTLLHTGDWVLTLDYHYAKNLLFVRTWNEIYTTNLKSKKNSFPRVEDTIRTKGERGLCFPALVVDWIHDKIIWVECNHETTINTMDLDGKNMSVLMTRPGNNVRIYRMEIDPFAGMIFWTAGGVGVESHLFNGVIESYELSVGNFKTNLSSDALVLALTLNLGERRVYYVKWVMDSSWSLFSMNYEGGSHREHSSSKFMICPTGLAVHKGYVYWDSSYGLHFLFKTSLDSGSTDIVLHFNSTKSRVWYMRVLHKDLQPTRDPSVSEASERPDQTLAHCPEGYQLSSNGLTCTNNSSTEITTEVQQ